MNTITKICCTCFAVLGFAQWLSAQTITLTFTGKDYEAYNIPLDSVNIFNYHRGWEETVYFPDTTLTLTQNVGIINHDNNNPVLTVYPNPFRGKATAQLWQKEDGMAVIRLTDLTGRLLDFWEGRLEQGVHSFNIHLFNTRIAVLTVQTSHDLFSQKIINMGHSGHDAIQYAGMQSDQSKSKGISNLPFVLNDWLHLTGYVTVDGRVYENKWYYFAKADSLITFKFEVISSYGKKPCPGAATVTDYDGNVYPTVQIGSQCWMQKNLRTTHYSNGDLIPFSTDTSNTFAYRYYPGLDSANVDFYGSLYNWMAVMHSDISQANHTHIIPPYDTIPDRFVQGICPKGWHVPSYYEFQDMKDYLSQYDIYRCGSDSMNLAKALAAKNIYCYNQECDSCLINCDCERNNSTGFTGLFAGRYAGPACSFFSGVGYYWTSTQVTNISASALGLHHNSPAIIPLQPLGTFFAEGHAVRCLKDE